MRIPIGEAMTVDQPAPGVALPESAGRPPTVARPPAANGATARHGAPADGSAPTADQLADQAAPLDALLVDAALSPLRRFAPDPSTAKLVTALARRPGTTSRRMNSLAAELGRIAVGTSVVAAPTRDRRFADPAWTENPLLRRIVQAYLAAGRTAEELVGDAALDWRDDKRIRFLTGNLTEALSPSNVPLVNPASAKAAIDTGGFSLARGGISLLRDLATPPRVPEMVDTSQFEVGRNIAVTPGAVVLRTEVLELIQYRPQTGQVREVPLLIVPPTINKYYALDLAPGRSLAEYLVRGGQQVFVISWRNPDARHASWGLDTYVEEVLGALDAVQRVSGAGQAAVVGACAGGIIASVAAAHLAATGQGDRLAAFVLLVTVLDTAQAGTVGALADRQLASAAKAISARRGYLDGRALAEVFAWLRPGDLIWNYWVNNYLLGKRPPAFDVLFWNADTTRMSARLHADFVDLAMDNKLVTPGALTVLGTAIDLSAVGTDAYVVAGITDHLTPWQNCYRSTQLLGGKSRFILSTSGHIAALVNPPGNPKARYQTSNSTPADAAEWLRTAETQQDSWWPDLLAWLGDRCGPEKPVPDELGGGGLRPIIDAPGTYVFDT
jgi:polyhydroxyalkanoate synthase subunit PhaC